MKENFVFTPIGCSQAGFYADFGHRLTEPLKNFLNKLFLEKNNLDFSITIDDSKMWKNYQPANGEFVSYYSELFQQDETVLLNLPIMSLCRDHWTKIPHTNFNEWNLLLQRFFTMSIKQKLLYDEITKKYNFDPKNTIGVYYRGTDKRKERPLQNINRFIHKTADIIAENPNIRIMLQTDQLQYKNTFLNIFKDRCFYIDELEHSESVDTGLHFQSHINKFNLARYMEISARMLSTCNYLVVPLSNVATFIGAYRNNSNNVFHLY